MEVKFIQIGVFDSAPQRATCSHFSLFSIIAFPALALGTRSITWFPLSLSHVCARRGAGWLVCLSRTLDGNAAPCKHSSSPLASCAGRIIVFRAHPVYMHLIDTPAICRGGCVARGCREGVFVCRRTRIPHQPRVDPCFCTCFPIQFESQIVLSSEQSANWTPASTRGGNFINARFERDRRRQIKCAGCENERDEVNSRPYEAFFFDVHLHSENARSAYEFDLFSVIIKNLLHSGKGWFCILIVILQT